MAKLSRKQAAPGLQAQTGPRGLTRESQTQAGPKTPLSALDRLSSRAFRNIANLCQPKSTCGCPQPAAPGPVEPTSTPHTRAERWTGVEEAEWL